nr:MAG TPA: Ribosome, ArfA, RF2, nonstop translation [Caudoviricetes sp.]
MTNKRTLNRDLLLSGTYKQRIVRAKKGKGSYKRKGKNSRGDNAPFSFILLNSISL